MTLVGFDIGVPADWDVLDLWPGSGTGAHTELVKARAEAGRLAGSVDQAVAGYDAAARGLRHQGVQWAAVLAERDALGVLAAVATLTLLSGYGGAARALAGLEVALAADPASAVRRFELPAGPAVGVQRSPPPAGPPGVTVQLHQPVPGTDLLALLMVTSPQEDALGDCSVWALAMAQSLRWHLGAAARFSTAQAA